MRSRFHNNGWGIGMLTISTAFSILAFASATTTPIKEYRRVKVISAADPRPRLRIATPLTLDTTTSYRNYGKAMRRTWQIFFEWLNHERGGVKIGGVWHKVELTLVGDRSNSAEAGYIARQLCVDRGIRFFLGPYGSGPTRQVSKELDACGALMIAPNAASTSVYAGRPRSFGTTTPATQYVLPAFRSVATKVTSMAIVYQGGGFTGKDTGACSVAYGQAQQFGIHFTNTDDVDAFLIASKPAAADVTNIVNGLKVAGKDGQPPDFILGCLQVDSCEALLTEMERQQFSVKIIMSMTCVTSASFMKNTGEAGRWVGGIAPWMPSMNLQSQFGNWSAQSYAAEYKARYGELPIYQGASAWAAAEIMIQAIEAADSLVPEEVAALLRTTSYDTVFGNIQFDANRQSMMDFKIVQYFRGDAAAPRVVYPMEHQTSPILFPIPKWDDRPCYDMVPTYSYYGYDMTADPAFFGEEAPCQPCPETKYALFNNYSQKRECRECESGQQASVIGMGLSTEGLDVVIRQCIKTCPAGSVAPDQTECKECQPGTYQLDASCVQCEPGTFTAALGRSECDPCTAGKFANQTGQTACEVCPPGKATSQGGEAQCDLCASGKYSVQEGLTECILCTPGFVSETTGQSQCHGCLPGTYSVWGALYCKDCEPGKFQPDPRQDDCVKVATGAAAPNEGMDYALNQKMFWAKRDYSVVNATRMKWELCKFTPDACLEQERCAGGNAGIQCQTCIPGYSRESPGSVCWKCWSTIYYAIVTVIMATGLTCLCIALAWLSRKAADRPQDMHSIILKLLMNHIITMNVVSMMLQEIVASATDLDQNITLWSNRIRMMFDWGDGTFPSYTPIWNVDCLLSTMRTPAQQKSLDTLRMSNHSAYLSPAHAADREVLRTVLKNDELVIVLFWFSWPVVLVLSSTFASWVWLQRSLARQRDQFSLALEFYKHVCEQGLLKARKRLMKEQLESYVNLYFRNKDGLFWPARHARKYLNKTPHLIDFAHFWRECQPIRAAVCFITFGSSVRGAARAMKCVTLEEGGSQVYLYRSEVVCSAGDSVFLVAVGCLFVWAIVYPTLVFYWIKSSKKSIEKDNKGSIKDLNYQWGLMLNGYKVECWYWEVVVYVRKGIGYMLYAAPFQWWSEEGRILCFLVMALSFACLHVSFDPYERRADGLLSRIEGYQLAIWILSTILLKYIQASLNTTSAILVPFTICLMHFIFVFWLLKLMFESICAGLTAGWDPAKIEELKPGLAKTIQMYIMDIPRRKAEKQPTLTMDHLYSWVSAYNGGFGDQPVPSVPKGTFADDHYKDHRPPVSLGTTAADYVANAMQTDGDPRAKLIVAATGKSRSRIQDALHATIACICGNRNSKATFSVSLLDFVIRAAFTLHFEDPGAGSQFTKKKGEVTEVSELVLKEAALHRDPIKLLMEADAARDGGEDKGGLDETSLMMDAARMEEHLNTTKGLAVIYTRMQLIHQIKKAHAENSQAAAVEGGQDDDGGVDSALQTKETRESKEKKLMIERLSKRVELMFSTAPYRREISLEDMQLKLLQIQHTPFEELSTWIDIFEYHWGIEKAKNADELRHLAGMFQVGSDKKPEEDETEQNGPRQANTTPSGNGGTQATTKEILRELRRKFGDDYGLRSVADGSREREVEQKQGLSDINLQDLPNDDKWVVMALALGFKKWSSIGLQTMALVLGLRHTAPVPMLTRALDNYFHNFRQNKNKELEQLRQQQESVKEQFEEDELPTEEQLKEFAKQRGVDLLPPLIEVRAPQAKRKAR